MAESAKDILKLLNQRPKVREGRVSNLPGAWSTEVEACAQNGVSLKLPFRIVASARCDLISETSLSSAAHVYRNRASRKNELSNISRLKTVPHVPR